MTTRPVRGVERLQLTWLVWAVALFTVLNSQRWITGNGPILLLLTALLIGVYAGLEPGSVSRWLRAQPTRQAVS